MSTQPLLIDNVAFAKRNERLAGSLSLADCPRLAELLGSQATDSSASLTDKDSSGNNSVINFTINGETNAAGQHFLHLVINAALNTYCQRCLEQMPLNLNLSFDYLISEIDAADADVAYVEDNDDYDIQEPSQAMDLLRLIEDEVIMATPIAPTHEGHCAQLAMQSGEKPNPFAVLKGLIKS
jgi:uncharacterized protein